MVPSDFFSLEASTTGHLVAYAPPSMAPSRCRLAILIASFVALFHLMPGLHSLSCDGHEGIENTAYTSLSVEHPECAACVLLSAHRHGIAAEPAEECRAPSAQTPIAPPTAPRQVAQVFSPRSPRGPPAA